ncbi:UNVERIFIED_CONTAM: hypothetical protein GTU68_024138 [Idotea baltica]|nr:hypothetical protein [Idotea baltica]
MTIFIIGFMGAGKTTLGKELAALLEIPFIDLDACIVESHQRSIAEIFDAEGQERFREIEHEALKILIENTNKDKIIATGGGAPCFHDNMKLMNESGITIYLRPPITELIERLIPQKAHRPLIRDIQNDSLEEFIGQFLEKREPYYLQAQVIHEEAKPTASTLIDVINSFKEG